MYKKGGFRMSSVSRSVYQKVCEENKRLKADIEILVCHRLESDKFLKRAEVRTKWIYHFLKQKQFNIFMKEAAIQYLEKHPEIKIPTL